jgi:hypothetical protein
MQKYKLLSNNPNKTKDIRLLVISLHEEKKKLYELNIII